MLKICRSEQWRARFLGACHRYLTTQNPAAAAVTATATETTVAPADSEYTEHAEYPEIQDLSFKPRKEREKFSWYEQIRMVPTVEEKQIKINMPRYYGYKVVELGDHKLPYNCLPAMQHYTRTVYEDMKGVESVAPETKAKLDALLQALKTELTEAIEYAHDHFSQKYAASAPLEPQERERLFSQLIVEQINRTLINVLAADYPHLHEVEIDYNPRHEAFWAVGGIDPPKNVVKSKKGREWQKEMANDPYDRLMQYKATPYLAVRHRQQLAPWKSRNETENIELAKQLPRYNYDPRTLGYVTAYQHATNIPGFWPGSVSNFGCISYQSRDFMQIRPESYGAEDFKEALHAHAIQASYAWLLAQANYNGFNTYNELTYPLNTQTIVTNGRDWSFYEYQLNTLLVHGSFVDENPRVNFCRGTPVLQLYDDISADGKCSGLNEEVLRNLVRFYVNVPHVQRSIAELQPYLGENVKRIADYANPEQREFLERIYKHMVSNRPRHLADPEIYLWEKIYKIDNKTRQMEPKRRFFELGINPWKRTLDQHQKEYIPRALRAEGPRSRKKWKPTYYP